MSDNPLARILPDELADQLRADLMHQLGEWADRVLDELTMGEMARRLRSPVTDHDDG